MKYIAEPHMHSMPSVTLHPNGSYLSSLPRPRALNLYRQDNSYFIFFASGKWLACQSMDNQIMIYGVHNNFRLNRKKNFKGHMVSNTWLYFRLVIRALACDVTTTTLSVIFRLFLTSL